MYCVSQSKRAISPPPLNKSASSTSHFVGPVFVHQCIPCTFFRTDYGCLEFFKCHTIITQHFLVYKFVMFYTRVLFAIMELILNWVLSQTKQAGRTIIHAHREFCQKDSNGVLTRHIIVYLRANAPSLSLNPPYLYISKI